MTNNTTAEVSEAMTRFSGSTAQGLIEEARAWPGNGGDALSAGHVGALLAALANRLEGAMQSERLKGDGEVERLREALENIRDLDPLIPKKGAPSDPGYGLRAAKQIAHAALSPPSDGVSR